MEPTILDQIIATASSGYPENFMLQFWNSERQEPAFFDPTDDDGLATFIVRELADTNDPEASELEQFEQATRALARAETEIHSVITALRCEIIKRATV